MNREVFRLKLLGRAPEMLRGLRLLWNPVLVLGVRSVALLSQIKKVLGRLGLNDQSSRLQIARAGHAHGLVVDLQIRSRLLDILQKLAGRAQHPESPPVQAVTRPPQPLER